MVISGCVDGNGETVEVSPTPTAEVTGETGGIQGIVASDEGLPIFQASVGVPELDVEMLTDKEGAYALSNLRPGTYQLFIQKVGFESLGKRVDVQPGEVTTMNVQLAPAPVAEPRQSTVIWNGYMKCSMGIWNVGWSEECGEGVGTPVGTFGKDPNNKIDWHFEQLEAPETILTETWWEPASAAASAMRVLIVRNLACEPFCEWDQTYADTYDDGIDGHPPVRLVVDGDDLPEDAAEYPVPLTVRHWAALGSEEEPVRLILEQPFEVYKTDFFGVPMEDVDPAYSALPPQ